MLARLAEPGAALGHRQVIGAALVGDLLAAPDLVADLDGVAGASERLLERHPVPALDHLRSGGPEAEHEPPVGQGVEGRCGLGDQGGAARVERDDAGHQLGGLGFRCEVAERGDQVVAVYLRAPQQVDTGRLEVAGLLGHDLRIAVE